MKNRQKALFRFLIITAILVLTATTFAANPIITNIYTADPAPMAYNDRFYIYCGRDEATAGQNQFVMREWRVFSTTDMVNWTDHGAPLRYNTFSWGTGDAWASQCVRGVDGRFYWYVSVNDNATNGWMSIGVAVSNSPTGPFADAKGTWLVNDQTSNSSPLNIDPTVLVDDDGQVYMYWGSYWGLRAVRLKSNMIELDGSIITPQGVQGFWEAPFLWKRNGIYYLAYAAGANPAVIDYCTSSNPMGPWTYRGRLCDTVSSPTNHPGVAEYKGNWYYVYHNANAPGGGEYRRSVCVDLMYYNGDGTIRKIVQTASGPPPVGGTPTPTPVTGGNLALNTTVSTSYCSSWESIAALNDGFDPAHSNDRSHAVYGNWPQTGTQWVQYDWSSPVTINRSDVYWFDDNQGIDLPASCQLKYWNGSSYVNAPNPIGLGVAGNQYNTTTFSQVTTTRLRLEMTGNGTYSTGILEWKVYGSGDGPTPIPTPAGDLVVWYGFDETSGTTAYDSSGNGRNASLINGPTWVAGRTGNGVDLDGSNDYVSMPSAIVSTLYDFTIAAWVRLDAVSTWSRIFDFGTGTTRNMFLAIRSGSGTIRFAITTNGNGAEQQINGNAALTTGSWQHVAVTLSGNLGILYVNGTEVGRNGNMTLRPASLGNTALNYIGRSQYADPYLDGRVDNFRIYNRALSAAEIGGLYTTGN